jgi:hypothetical protein
LSKINYVLLITLAISLIVFGCRSGGPQQPVFTAWGSITYNNQGLSDITINFSNNYGSVITVAQGNWSKSGLSGTVVAIPSHPDWVFSPVNATLSSENRKADFTATPSATQQFTASGRITQSGQGLAGITLNFSGGLDSVVTDAQGNWSKSGLTGSVIVTPTHSDWVFSPTNAILTEQNSQADFTATPSATQQFTASGRITQSGQGLAGITINFSGGYSSVVTNAQGYWSKSGLAGQVTVTPSHIEWSFTPKNATVSAINTQANFTASPKSSTDGIAASYPGDQGIGNDPHVVFFEDFEGRTVSQIQQRWGCAKNYNNGLTLVTQTLTDAVGNTSMQMKATRSNDAAELYKTFSEGWDQLYLRFYTKFAADHGFNHHFVALRGFKNPTSCPMGGAGSAAPDYFSVTIEPTSVDRNKAQWVSYPPPGIWQFYSYWPEMRSWQTPQGVPDGRPNPYYGNTFQPIIPAAVERDEWICVEIMIKLNSAPDVRDGELAFWLNGELILHMAPGTPKGYFRNDQYRNDPTHQNAQPFEGFLWRTDMDVKINVLRLQHYISSGTFDENANYLNKHPGFLVNTQQALVWFDNVVLATEYIGPITPIE